MLMLPLLGKSDDTVHMSNDILSDLRRFVNRTDTFIFWRIISDISYYI